MFGYFNSLQTFNVINFNVNYKIIEICFYLYEITVSRFYHIIHSVRIS